MMNWYTNEMLKECEAVITKFNSREEAEARLQYDWNHLGISVDDGVQFWQVEGYDAENDPYADTDIEFREPDVIGLAMV